MNAAAMTPAHAEPSGSFAAGFAWALRRDLTLAWRHPGETVLVVAFFVLVASLFPLAHSFITNNFVRGAVSGLGVLNLLAGIVELTALFLASRSAEATAVPPVTRPSED